MADSIARLSDQLPHLSIRAEDGNYFVLPAQLVRDVIAGNSPLTAIEPVVLRAMLRDFLADAFERKDQP